MAAFLTVDVLRAHAAPGFPQVLFGHAHEPVRRFVAPRSRPALTARWLVAPDARPSVRGRAERCRDVRLPAAGRLRSSETCRRHSFAERPPPKFRAKKI
jgi:hypothetical protein